MHYHKIDEQGLHIERDGKTELIDADSVVICAGQESVRPFEAQWAELGDKLHVIGGTDVAGELEAARAIRQVVELAVRL